MIPPRLPLDHARSDRTAEVGQGADIEIDHLPLALCVELGEAADQPEAGVVDQQVDSLAVRLDIRHQLGRGILLRQVDRHRPRIAELLRELLEPLLAPGGKHQA